MYLLQTGHVIFHGSHDMEVKTTFINVGKDYWKMENRFETCDSNYEILFPDVISRSCFGIMTHYDCCINKCLLELFE